MGVALGMQSECRSIGLGIMMIIACSGFTTLLLTSTPTAAANTGTEKHLKFVEFIQFVGASFQKLTGTWSMYLVLWSVYVETFKGSITLRTLLSGGTPVSAYPKGREGTETDECGKLMMRKAVIVYANAAAVNRLFENDNAEKNFLKGDKYFLWQKHTLLSKFFW